MKYDSKKDTTVNELQHHLDGFTNDKAAAGSFSQSDIIGGKPIMAKMPNETIRAELGRAGWKVFHTILAQYPDHPTPEERQTLESYIYLFSRVYPCRECAEHFQKMLQEHPPQTSSKEHASQWGCHVHNIVNKRLGKPIFDCMDISDKYACGCDDDEKEKDKNKTNKQGDSKTTSDNLRGLKIDEKQDITGGWLTK